MPINTLASIAPALPLEFDKKLARQWSRSAKLLSLLEVRMQGGKSVNWDVQFSSGAAASYNDGADVSSGEVTGLNLQPAVLPWALYRRVFAMTQLAIDAASSSTMVATEIKNMFSESLFDNNADLMSKLNKEAYIGTGANTSLIGLIPALTADTYAGLSASTESEWRANIKSGGSLANLTDFRKMEADLFTVSGKRPDVIVTNASILSTYGGLFDTALHLIGGTRKFDIAADPTDMLYFEGIPVIRDKDCPDGYAFFLNLDDIYVAAMPPTVIRDSAIYQVSRSYASDDNQSEDPIGLPVRMRSYATQGASSRFSIDTTCQLVVRRRNTQGVMFGL